ncbi:hypothetical protein B7494_g2637 [Chlorociboria aeruginascens]|nr:hypothetical protein B7494_g2637 [Chlorociboria aeruginascens]
MSDLNMPKLTLEDMQRLAILYQRQQYFLTKEIEALTERNPKHLTTTQIHRLRYLRSTLGDTGDELLPSGQTRISRVIRSLLMVPLYIYRRLQLTHKELVEITEEIVNDRDEIVEFFTAPHDRAGFRLTVSRGRDLLFELRQRDADIDDKDDGDDGDDEFDEDDEDFDDIPAAADKYIPPTINCSTNFRSQCY